MGMIESGALGKKVFFLYPPAVIQETSKELARREFEVYLVKDHKRLAKALVSMPDSLVFINLGEGMAEGEWEAYVRALRSSKQTASIGLGVLSLDEDKELMQKYLIDLQLSCGFIVVKLGAQKTLEILVKTLEANEARGRRRFVRASCPRGQGQCIVMEEGRQVRAEVSDISSAGMAISFQDGMSYKAGAVLRGLQLNVKGIHLIVDGFVAAKRDEGNSIHIVMFDPSSLDEVKKEKLRDIVLRLNQASMDRLLETVV